MQPWTADFCEREYNARAHIPHHPQIFARWAEQASATRRLRACLIDLHYGQSGAERLDFFPTHAPRAPVLVFIHGGYWRSLDKGDFSWIAPPFVTRGISVATINYGLAPKVPIEDMVRQTLGALTWLYRRSEQLDIDPGRLYLCGHSAGAHLAAMAAAALWPRWAPDLPADLVKGCLAVSGLFDLRPLVHADFVNRDLRLDEARALALSPAYLPATVPLYTAVGARESSEFKRQSALLASRWRSGFVRDVPAPGANHLDICDQLAAPDSALHEAALEMVGI